MSEATLEHINLTVADVSATAQVLIDLFDWHIRWQGDAIHGGHSIHVGGESSYLALYSRGELKERQADTYNELFGLNHIAVVVDDIHATEQNVLAAGFKTYSHASYEPGQRFYFDDSYGLEIEVVSYR